MFSFISTALSFVKGNAISYLGLGVLGAISIVLYLNLQAEKARLEKVKTDLNVTLEANYNLHLSLETLKAEHKRQIQALNKANESKNEIKEKIEYVNKYIYKEYKNGENNITKLFNVMVSRLWQDTNASR